jgi:DNA-binding NarL/FixJ family response regulator
MPIRIAIGCQNHLLGEGIRKLLGDEKGIKTVVLFNEGKDYAEILKIRPDLFLLDSALFKELEYNQKIGGEVKILLIGDKTLYTMSERRVLELIAMGVVGIFPPASTSDLLKKAIKGVLAGELWLDRKAMSSIISDQADLKKKEINLTKAEKEIVSLLCHGYRNKEIAIKLAISEQTVKSHCNRAFKKVGVTDRLQLALQAYKLWPELINPAKTPQT